MLFPPFRGSEILRAKARIFSDLGKRGWADFLAVVEAEREVGPARTLQLSMGPNLLLECPTEPQ
jgi:hypothetical protein